MNVLCQGLVCSTYKNLHLAARHKCFFFLFFSVNIFVTAIFCDSNVYKVYFSYVTLLGLLLQHLSRIRVCRLFFGFFFDIVTFIIIFCSLTDRKLYFSPSLLLSSSYSTGIISMTLTFVLSNRCFVCYSFYFIFCPF